MKTTIDIKNEDKTGDTANTVQILDCTSATSVTNVESRLASEILTLIDILARQAAREICNTKESE